MYHITTSSKPRIIALYTELISLKRLPSESVIDHIFPAETAATWLKTAKETISDSLLLVIVLEILPPEFVARLQ